MEKRRVIQQLPPINQTETLKKFFGATIDHLFQKGMSEQISGYIGAKPRYFDPQKDFYVPEPTRLREEYQLEPALISRNKEGEATHIFFYEDLINYLHGANAFTNNHYRLFADEYYNWAPPVDIDKLMNAGEYYWFGDAPNAVPICVLRSEHVSYVGDGVEVSFKLPPKARRASGEEVSSEFETPCVFVDGIPVAAEVVGDTIVTETAPPTDADVTVFRYGDLTAIFDGSPMVDVSPWLTEGSPLRKITSGLRLRLDDGVSFFQGWDTLPWETLFLKQPIRCSQNYEIGWDQYNRAATMWVEGVGSKVALVPFPEKMTIPGNGEPVHVVIDRRSRDRNPWSINNFWVHKDAVEWCGRTFTDRKATRPIIEFLPNIELANYGTRYTGDITALLTGELQSLRVPLDDPEDFMAVSDWDVLPFDEQPYEASGYETISVFDANGKQLGTLFTDIGRMVRFGDRILVLDTSDNRVRSRIIEVSRGETVETIVLDDGGAVTTSVESLAVVLTDLPSKGDIVRLPVLGHVPWDNRFGYDKQPWVYSDQPVDFYFDGSQWQEGQKRRFEDSDPLFALYTYDGISHADIPGSDFAGNRLFGFAKGSGVVDAVVGRPLLYENFGSSRSEIVFENDVVSRKTNVDGEKITGLQFYRIAGETPASDVYGSGWHATGEWAPPQMRGDLFLVPMNLTANPDNEEPMTISRGHWFDHFSALISRQEQFEGVPYRNNNWRDTRRSVGAGYNATGVWDGIVDYEAGDTVSHKAIVYRCLKDHRSGETFDADNWEERPLPAIVQHRSPLVRTMLLASDKRFDYLDAVRFVDGEYQRFRNKFIAQVAEHHTSGALVEEDDDAVWVDTILNALRVTKTNEFPFALSNVGGGQYFIPPSPAALGLLPVVEPGMEIDDTYGTPVSIIRGHDGSRSFAFGDIRDRILLALETLIWRNIDSSFKSDDNHEFDFADLVESRARLTNSGDVITRGDPNPCDTNSDPVELERTSYSQEEYVRLYTPIFIRWAQLNGYDYKAHADYVEDDPFTWNYRGVKDRDGVEMPGNWRAIYRWWFDTDRPHLSPWEMLGFAQKPSWWDNRYGAAPYTRGNLPMWEDIRDGIIRDGPRRGVDSRFRRPDLLEVLPVDDQGKLLDPIAAGIILEAPSIDSAKREWMIGDHGPVENIWLNSASYPFAKALVAYLMRPAEWIEIGWDRLNRVRLPDGQWINKSYGKRPRGADERVHGEIDEDGNRVVRVGIQQWICDYMASNSQASSILGEAIRGMTVNLSHKMAGFTNAKNLRVFADNFGLLPPENVEVLLHSSAPIREAVYSGVLIEWTGDGWKVIGYDTVKEGFCLVADPNEVPGDEGSDGSKTRVISLGEDTPIYEWRPNIYYQTNQLVEYRKSYYRAIRAHTSSSQFEDEYWSPQPGELNKKTPKVVIHERNVEWKDPDYTDIVYKYVPYSTVFRTHQEIAQFLWDYGLTLERAGFIFDEVDPVTGEVMNFEYAIREFLKWAQMDWQPGNFIALSPGASTLKFVARHGTVYNVEETYNGVYGLLNRTGAPLPRRSTFVSRLDDETKIITTTDDLFAARLRVGEIEHVLVFSDTTIFNDIVYAPLYNLRQPRLRLIGQRSSYWKGRMDAPGYVIAGNEMHANYDRASENIRDMYDIERSEDRNFRDYARHQVGYQTRGYLDNLLLSETQQFETYQGMIQSKGSVDTFDRLTRSQVIDDKRQLRFLEEWAFQIGRYGALNKRQRVSFNLVKTDIRNNPQRITFGIDDPFDAVVDVPTDSARWVEQPSSVEMFAARSQKNEFNGIGSPQTRPWVDDLPTAGPIRLDEIHFTVAQYSSFNDLYEIVSEGTGNQFGHGTRIWVYDTLKRDMSWDVLQLYSISSETNYLEKIEGSDDDENLISQFRMTFAEPHGLNESDVGLFIIIADDTDTDPNLAGFHSVANVESETTLIIDEYVQTGAEYITRSRPIVYVLRSQRFDGIQARDAFYDRYPARKGDLCYIQPVDGPWTVYRWDGADWEVYREQPDKIASNRLKAALIYDKETKIDGRNTISALPVLMDDITVYDPVAGLIPGVAEKEITWKYEYDPASYIGETRWGREQVGKLWWNLGAVSYLVCETDRLDVENEERRRRELDYRSTYWGRLAPGSDIEIYEWVRAEVPPEAYDGETHNAPYTSYVRNEEWDDDLNKVVAVYYFWAKNSDRDPVNVPGRSMSALRVSDILRNPKAQDIPWIAPISGNSILVSGVEQFLGDETSVLQFEIEDPNIDGVVHDEWQLIRAADSMTVLPENIWRPLRNSLVGFDDFGKPVPDENLSPDDRVGLSIYPRRTLFDSERAGVLAARKSLVESVNSIFSRESVLAMSADLHSVLDLNSPVFEQLFWKRPVGMTAMVLPPVGAYDFEVSSLEERDALLASYDFQVMRGFLPWEETAWDEDGWEFDSSAIPTVSRRSPRILITNYEAEQPSWGIWELDETAPLDVANPDQYLRLARLYDVAVETRLEMVERASELSYGARVLVRSDETAQGFWTVYSYIPGALNADLDGFMLTSTQTYRTTDFWSAVDWYAEGHNKLNPPIVSYPTIEARNIREMPRPVNTFVKVDDDGTGAWVWTAYENGNWQVVAREKGTVRLSSKFFDDERVVIKGDNINIDMIERRDGSLELKAILDALRAGVFSNSQINEVFFSMLHFIHTQQQNIPWAFKTSFMSIVGFNEKLSQSPVKTYDQTENIISYIEEVKPYRVKLRDFARTLAPDIDLANVHATDFDKPVYFDETIGRYRTLDPRREEDMAILTTMSPWKDWAEKFTNGSFDPASSDFNPVRRLLIKMRFDRVDHQEVPHDSGIGWDLGPLDVLGFDSVTGGSHGGSALARMLAFYRPSQGMREKNIETLLGLSFRGVVTDGGDLFQPDDYEYSDWDIRGYDSLPWETILTAEKDILVDGNSVEEIDVSMNPTGAEQSYYKLNDPYNAPNRPQELIAIQSNTAVNMTVETSWTVGAPRQYTAYVNTKRSRRATVNLSYGAVASSADAIFVYRDGIRARDGVDYTIDHHARRIEVKLGTPRAQKVMVHVFGHGGLTAIHGQTFLTGDGETREFDLPFETNGAVEITVDGRRMMSNEAYISDGRIVFVDAPESGADICFTAFEPIDGVLNPATNVVKESLLVHDEQRWTLGTPSITIPSQAIGTIVELNGKRLTPPFIRIGGYSADERHLSFTSIDDVNNISMWIDGEKYTGEINSVPGEEYETEVTFGWDTYEWDIAEEVYAWATVEQGLDCRPLDTDLLDVRADFVVVGEHIFANNINFLPDSVMAIGYEGHEYDVVDGELVVYTPIGDTNYDTSGWEDYLWDDGYTVGADTRVEVTTFENPSSLGIATHVFDGSPSGMYELPVEVEDSQYVWVWVNGHRLIAGVDYDTTIETLRWDQKTLDHVGAGIDSTRPRVLVTIPGGQEPHERIVIMTFSASPVVPPSTWGMHTAVPSSALPGDPVLGVDFGFAPLDTVPLASTVARKAQSSLGERTLYRMNGSWEVYDWTDDVRITLASPLSPNDREIVLKAEGDDYPADMRPLEMLPEPDIEAGIPGIVFINGERIEYFEKESSGEEIVLRELRRGTRGTRENYENRISVLHQGDGATRVFAFPGASLDHPLEVSVVSEDGSLDALHKDVHFTLEQDVDGLTVTLYRIPKVFETVRLAQTTTKSHPVGSIVRSGLPATNTAASPFRIREETYPVDIASKSRVYLD